MMGRSHALTGAFTAGLAIAAVGHLAHLTPAETVFGTVACAGAAVLPDIDHPDAGVSRTFGPLTRAFAKFVAWVSGGHRNGTHSLLGCAVFTVAAFAATGLHTGDPGWLVAGGVISSVLAFAGFVIGVTDRGRGRGKPAYPRRGQGRVAVALLAALAAVLTVAAVVFGHRAGTAALAVLMVLLLSAATRFTRFRRGSVLYRLGRYDDLLPIPVTAAALYFGVDLRVIPFAVLIGVLTHFVGDMVTGGVPLGWPWSQTNRGVRLFNVNSATENGPVFAACVVAFAATVAWNSGFITAITNGA